MSAMAYAGAGHAHPSVFSGWQYRRRTTVSAPIAATIAVKPVAHVVAWTEVRDGRRVRRQMTMDTAIMANALVGFLQASGATVQVRS